VWAVDVVDIGGVVLVVSILGTLLLVIVGVRPWLIVLPASVGLSVLVWIVWREMPKVAHGAVRVSKRRVVVTIVLWLIALLTMLDIALRFIAWARS
jgi:hypothetical protein